MATPIKLRIMQFLFLAIISVFAVACGKKNVKKAALADSAQQAQSDSLAAGAIENVEEQEGNLRDKSYTVAPEVRKVYFDFDRSELSAEARDTLSLNADILRKRASVEIQIAGHCDERGTTQYNLALGQSRANTVRNYYKALGIKTGRMSTISYGEENPACQEPDKECWQRNRRAETLIRRQDAPHY